MLFGPLLLVGLSVAFGVAPALIQDAIVREAAASIAGEAVSTSLALWHGFNLALLLSIVSVAAGAAIYRYGTRGRRVSDWLLALPGPLRPGEVYESALIGLNKTATWQTRILQDGYLRHYLAVTLAVAIALPAGALLFRGGVEFDVDSSGITFYEAVVAGIVVVGAGAAVFSDSRLAAVVALGAVGFGAAFIYALFGAPELALTQFLIETLSVMLFVLVFYRLPKIVDRSTMSTRVRDAALSLAVGGLMTLLVLASLNASFGEGIAGYFAENSATVAFGRNVVNVIIVDFRALDTLGEITVLAIAAFGIFALLKMRLGRAE